MATVALTTAGVLEVVEWPDPPDAISLPLAADAAAGTFVRENASGNWEAATGASAAAAAGAHLLLKTGKAGEARTGIKRGTVSGFTITQAYNAPLYVSDTGTLADTVGTATVQVGRVIAGTANLVTAAKDKLIRIDIPV